MNEFRNAVKSEIRSPRSLWPRVLLLTSAICLLTYGFAEAFEGFLKQSTAVNVTVLMIDSTDHITGKTGLTLTIKASKAAGAYASITPTVTELETGTYKLALTTSHTDTLGELALKITSTGADPVDLKWQVSSYLPGEAATLQADQAVNTTKFGGTTVTGRDLGASVLLSSGTGTGQISLSSGTVTVGTNNDKTGYSLSVTPPTAATIASAVWQDTTAGDFTVALSIGKSVLNGVSLGTGLTINAYTGNTPQTGDAYARIGAAGAGLTALGDTRIANLDAAVTSRMASYTQPTGFLAATFPTTVASTTNITAGTITTTTNLTNLPSIPANWLTAAGIASGALNGKGDWNIGKTGYSLTQAFPTNFADLAITATTGRVTAGTVSDKTGYTVSTVSDKTGYSLATDVWDETLASHLTSGTTGAALNAAGAAGDPWSTTLPGAYGAGTAGYILGNNLDAAVSTRSSHSAADVWAVATRAITDKAGFSLTSAYDPAKTAAQPGDSMVSSNERGTDNALLASNYTAPPSAATIAGQVTTDHGAGSYVAPTDYQQRSVAVTLPSPAPAGYGGGAGSSVTWEDLAADHNTAGTIGAKINSSASAGDPWSTALPGSYGAGTAGAIVGAINPPNITVLSPVSREGSKITVRTGDTWTIPITGLGDISTRTKLWFSINAPGAADTAAKAFIEETGGLTVVNGATYATTANGAIVVNNETLGNVTITINKSVTSLLSGTTNWAVKELKSDGTAVTLTAGSFAITKPGIEAIQ